MRGDPKIVRKWIRAAFCSIVLFVFTGCSKEIDKIDLKKIVSGLKNPVFLTAPANERNRLYIVEQIGRIRVYQDGKLLQQPFLDLTHKVRWNGGEMGMLGLAFHPRFFENGYFYVAYTDRRRVTWIERYKAVNSDPVDPSSKKVILSIKRHSRHHHGGMLLFGEDGKLLIGVGDGSVSGDPKGNAQNKTTLFGNLLRIDVDHGDPYSVPEDNPYYGHSEWKGEIWASGLRNPWRFSLDHKTQLLYIADAGEKLWEEINAVPAKAAGLNFGWRIMEGSHCFTKATSRLRVERYKPAASCDTEGLTLPVAEFSHSEGCAIIGGYVYRGDELPSIQGHYFYADYCLGWIRSFRYDGKETKDQRAWDLGIAGNILSFGEDPAKNLYVLYESGDVYRFAKKQ